MVNNLRTEHFLSFVIGRCMMKKESFTSLVGMPIDLPVVYFTYDVTNLRHFQSLKERKLTQKLQIAINKLSINYHYIIITQTCSLLLYQNVKIQN